MTEEQERALVAALQALNTLLDDVQISCTLNDNQWVVVDDARNIIRHVAEGED